MLYTCTYMCTVTTSLWHISRLPFPPLWTSRGAGGGSRGRPPPRTESLTRTSISQTGKCGRERLWNPLWKKKLEIEFWSILKVAMTFIAEHLWKISTSFCIEGMPLTQRFSSKPSPSSIRDVIVKFWLNWTELQLSNNESKFQVPSVSLSLSEPVLHHWQLPPARPGAQLAGEGPLYQDGGPQAGSVSVRRHRIHKEVYTISSEKDHFYQNFEALPLSYYLSKHWTELGHPVKLRSKNKILILL